MQTIIDALHVVSQETALMPNIPAVAVKDAIMATLAAIQTQIITSLMAAIDASAIFTDDSVRNPSANLSDVIAGSNLAVGNQIAAIQNQLSDLTNPVKSNHDRAMEVYKDM